MVNCECACDSARHVENPFKNICMCLNNWHNFIIKRLQEHKYGIEQYMYGIQENIHNVQ